MSDTSTKRQRGHTDRAEAEMAVHVAALTKPVGELIEAVLRKHHRAVLEAVKELHERCAKAEAECKRLQKIVDRYRRDSLEIGE